MKYICLGYYDKGKFEAMTESERNGLFDRCFEYDDHLRANGHWGGGEALQGPGFGFHRSLRGLRLCPVLLECANPIRAVGILAASS
jgi:hypothetical protein